MDADATFAPGTPPATPVYAYWMTVTPGRVKGTVSDFREGNLTITQEGIAVNGRAVLAAWLRALLLLGSFVLCIGVLLAAILLEYAIRIARTAWVPWSSVEEIVLETARNRTCLVYHPAEKPASTENLAFRLEPAAFANFAEVARYFAPQKVREGKIGPASSPWAIAIVILVLIVVLGVIMYYASSPGR